MPAPPPLTSPTGPKRRPAVSTARVTLSNNAAPATTRADPPSRAADSVCRDAFLQAPLQSINPKTGQGAWNAARFNNPTYDSLSKQFIAAVDLSTQRQLAGQIERLLLDETPIIYPYFYDYLSAAQKNVTGVYPTAIGELFLWNAAKSS
jgi:ABC-type transport system substrate-binding protein